jgi:hypothetical protein
MLSDSQKRLETEKRLADELEKARAEYRAASTQFRSAVNDSGIPQPDGDLHIRQTGQATRTALENYRRAIQRFNDCTVYGIVPDDLFS